jgi:ATP-dependent helicase/nuclease subunit A
MSDHPWTAEQSAAILAQRDTLLSANAGSGKTTTVVGKILWLLGLEVGKDGATGKTLPRCPDPCELHEIAAITFTEKAAHDLKQKLRKEILASSRGEELRWVIDRASIGTIHSFCGSLLREHALRLGIDPTFMVLDENEARTVLDDLIREVVLEQLEAGDEGTADLYRRYGLLGFTFTKGTVDLVRDALRDLRWHAKRYESWCIDAGDRLGIEELKGKAPEGIDRSDESGIQVCAALYRLARAALRRWDEYQREENVRDFDALILETLALLTGPNGGPALHSIRKRYRILIIDEFQDTDRAQADIAFALGRGVDRPQLFFVGDPKQSIYRFRGAEIDVWNTVREELREDGEILSLTQNFRSQPELIDFLNVVGEAAIEEAGEALERTIRGSRVRYSELTAGLKSEGTAAVEFLDASGSNADARRTAEGDHVARRIREMVDGGELIVDPDTGGTRPCRYRDMAILYRSRSGIEHYLRMLALHGVPVFHPAQGGLAEQQEIADLVNALRLIDNPADDLAAFAFLRSPFVGLRDEVVTRIALERGRKTLIRRAQELVEEAEWWTPPEGEQLCEVERDALHHGLDLLSEVTALAARLPLDELLAHLLDRSGYRLHLLLMGENRVALGNLQNLLRLAEQYRRHPVGDFLDIWERWSQQETGLPQAPLYSADDDVVTMTTIHRAKGLEWPIVFFIDCAQEMKDLSSGNYWSDREFGPIVAPNKNDRGPRAATIVSRYSLEGRAEEARLLYVATTRARDRLIITGPVPKLDAQCYLRWLLRGRDHPIVSDLTAAAERAPPDPSPRVELAWLDRVRRAPLPALAAPIDAPPLRHLSSATEVMMRENRPDEWKTRYVHGVEPSWAFAPRGGGENVPAHVHGTIVHRTLERSPPGPLEEAELAEELSRILDEVIGDIDEPELEPRLASDTSYRTALEREIARVVSSREWRWYTEGIHYRELGFLHLADRRLGYVGALDLYRADLSGAWIIDFKTHRIRAERVASAARDYEHQARIYRDAAAVQGTARTLLHFTNSGVVVEMMPDGRVEPVGGR